MLVAAPSSFGAVIFGRIAATTAIGTVSFFEAWLVARLIFGATVTIHHWGAFVLTVFATLAAMAGTAVGMAALFVLARNAVTFSNSASYPFYVLGGILVPVSLLPHWVRPLSAVVFLSWSADLLRATLQATPIHRFWPHLGMVALLGACGYAVGLAALRVILVRVRESGELSTT
jgi:ABC-2 type transport system permease protein